MKRAIDTKEFTGLSEVEAAGRLAAEGYNELPSAGERGLFSLAFGVVREPMFLLLVACGGCSIWCLATSMRR